MYTAKEVCDDFATLKFPTKRICLFLLIFVPKSFYYFASYSRADLIVSISTVFFFAIHKLMKVKMSTIVLF